MLMVMARQTQWVTCVARHDASFSVAYCGGEDRETMRSSLQCSPLALLSRGKSKVRCVSIK